MMTETVRFRIGWRATEMTRSRDGGVDRFTIVSHQKPLATMLAGLPVAILAVATVTYAMAHRDIVTLVMAALLGYMLYELARSNFGTVLLCLGREVEATSMLVIPGLGALPLGPTRRWPLDAVSSVSMGQTEYGKAKTKPVDWPGYGLDVKTADSGSRRLVSGITLEQAGAVRTALLDRMERGREE
ncbi:hypothetical protein [Stappia stellulata]|uniref:hypothetical protein n=1 Tax=Stappia stellulata TaxID=71235 RepID=UPI0003F7DD34|nr:hypothetical protein [Stappia stellulata]